MVTRVGLFLNKLSPDGTRLDADAQAKKLEQAKEMLGRIDGASLHIEIRPFCVLVASAISDEAVEHLRRVFEGMGFADVKVLPEEPVVRLQQSQLLTRWLE